MADNEANANANVDEATSDVEFDLEDDTTSFETETETEDEVEEAATPDTEESEEESEEPEEDQDGEEEVESEEAEADDTEEAKDDTETPETEAQSEEDVKARNKEMAERRIKAKQEREAMLAKSQQEYIAEAEDEQTMALRELQVEAYNNKVSRNESKLTSDYEKAQKDFDVLRNANPAIQAEVDAAIDAFQAQYVRVDEAGNPVEVRGDLYAYLQNKAESITRLTGIGAQGQIKSKAREKAKAAVIPSRAPQKPKVDADIAAFDEEALR